MNRKIQSLRMIKRDLENLEPEVESQSSNSESRTKPSSTYMPKDIDNEFYK